MTFSVIIPCYNCESTLEATVNSIRTSGLTDYEILLIDDGSNDGTAECCDALCARYPEARCVHQRNAGVSAARNRGIDEARGEYIWFVDADDMVDVLNMPQIWRYVSDGADCIMFGMKFLYMWHEKTIMQESLTCDSSIELTHQNIGIHFRTLFERNYFSAIWNKFIRKSIITENALYFDCTLTNYEDLHFSLMLLKYCKAVVALPEQYYRYNNIFGHDRTVERVHRIPDIIAYTDQVAAPFYALEAQLCESDSAQIEGLSVIVLRLYMEAAYFKLKTANRYELKQLCTSVKKSKTIQKEAHSIAQLSKSDQRLYYWMMNGSYAAIWLFMRYRALRGIGGRLYRITKCYLGNKT